MKRNETGDRWEAGSCCIASIKKNAAKGTIHLLRFDGRATLADTSRWESCGDVEL
jgi:hypothetical protein